MTLFGVDVRDLGALTAIVLGIGGVMSAVVILWIRFRLSETFASTVALVEVRGSVTKLDDRVGHLSGEIAGLREEVHVLPTNKDLTTIRHDVKDLLQQNAALGAQVVGQGQMLGGMDGRLTEVLAHLLERGSRS